MVGRESSEPIINKSKLLYRLRRQRTAARAVPTSCKRQESLQTLRADDIRPYGRQNKSLQRLRAACAVSVRRVAATYKL